MSDHGVDKLIFSNTCAIYGVPEQVPITEDHPQRPINPYGMSKLIVEQNLRDFGSAHALRSISLRYFNAAGADPDDEIGESHDPETHLIPLVLDAPTDKRPAITVFGNDYDTPDETCIRDYIHVSDLAYAHVLALQALEYGDNTTLYNLGNGNGFTVRAVIAVAQKVTDLHVPFLIGPRRVGDPAKLVEDAKLARRMLGWNPKYSKLEQMVLTAWK